MSDVMIRTETAADVSMIRLVNDAAFGGADEGMLVESLRSAGLVLLSAVAEQNKRIVGHILFSRMAIETPTGMVPAVALAPMAVFPGYQRQGIGGRLVRYGLDALRKRGERIVIVVGHAAYYPRFGFSSEKAGALEGPFSRDVFMAMELEPGALDGIRGRVKYPSAFGI